jgi:hypothetical protein
MAKKTQIERAIDALIEQKSGILAKCNAECDGIDAAIQALRNAKPRARKPRVVERATEAVPA